MSSKGLGLAAGMALSIVASAASGQSVLRVVPHSDLKVLDPAQTAARISANYANMVFEILYAWDEGLNVKPQIVENAAASADKLCNNFLRQTDDAEKTKAIEVLHRRLWQTLPSIPKGLATSPFVWRKNVESALSAPVLPFHDIRKA